MSDTKLRLQQELISHARQQEVIADLGQRALASTSLQKLLDSAAQAVADALQADFCRILQLLPNRKTLLLKAGIGWNAGLVGTATVGCGTKSEARYVLLSQKPVIVDDLAAETRFDVPELLRSHAIASGMSVIIGGNAAPYGLLGVHTRSPRVFTADDTHFLRGISNLLATAISRRQSERELVRLAAIVEASPDAIVSSTLDGTITSWNMGASEMYGYSAKEAGGRNISFLYPPDRLHELDEMLGTIKRGEWVEQYETVRVCRDGREIDVSVSASPLRDANGNVVALSTIARDVTVRKQAERQLKEINEALEQRIGDRTRSLFEYQEQLRGMASQLTLVEQQERRRLAADLHDYLAQLLVVCRMNVGRLSDELHSPRAQAVLEETDGLLNESLTYTRSLISQLSPTILYDAGLAAALKWLSQQMERNGLRVEFRQTGDAVELPEDRAILLFQTVRELLFNVLKHANVDCAAVELVQKPQELTVSVQDAGDGFSLTTGGSGPAAAGKYGLFSIRERLEAMGGSMEIVSALEQGTRVTICVPVPRSSGKSDPCIQIFEPGERLTRKIPAGKGGQRSIRILLADDHDMVREGLRRIIETNADFKVIGEAANGEAAVDKARELRPQVVVMDINMPRMNGIEATRRIAQELPEIAIIGLSVHDDRELAEAMREAGAIDYLTKGCPSEELSRAIRAAGAARAAEPVGAG